MRSTTHGYFIVAAMLAPAAIVHAASGAGTYATTCGVCHEYGVSGAPRIGQSDEWLPRIAQGKEVLYRHAIHGFKGMPARGANPELSDAEVRKAVDYMLREVKQ